MKLQSKERLVMIGDSITDSGRARPVGTFSSGLGDGYVALVDALLTAAYPERRIEVLNTGIGGNTVRDLTGRWKTDVIDLKPDWLTMMIGTNDVWRQFDSPNDPHAGVLEHDYTAQLDALIKKTKPLVKGMVVLTPFLIEKNLAEPMRAKMDIYTGLAKQVGRANDVPVLDVQAAYDQALQHLPPQLLAGDRVHPTLPGHMILAKLVLTALEFDWTRLA